MNEILSLKIKITTKMGELEKAEECGVVRAQAMPKYGCCIYGFKEEAIHYCV